MRVIWMLPLALFAAGCGKDRQPVYPVEGQLLVDGKPAARAVVTFHPVDDATAGAVRPVGHVDDSGRFTLTSYKEGDGAPPGDYAVTVTWYRATKTADGSGDYVARNYLPQHYAVPETARLRATVSADGANTLEAFNLRTR
jgi:hypothetical protein